MCMNVIRLDNRGLSPPEPMLHILSACETLNPGDRIEAQMDRRPIFLFPELDDRGVRYECVQCQDGGYLLTVERPT